MLILTRRPGEALRIGDDIRLVVLQSSSGKVRLGIEGPLDMRVLREELYAQVRAANQQARMPVTQLSLQSWLQPAAAKSEPASAPGEGQEGT